MEPVIIMNLGMAVLAMTASVWVWLGKQRRERPNLRAYGNRLIVFSGDPVEHPFTVANLSSLPDVLFGVRVWGMGKNGRWLLLEGRTVSRVDQSYLPPNVK